MEHQYQPPPLYGATPSRTDDLEPRAGRNVTSHDDSNVGGPSVGRRGLPAGCDLSDSDLSEVEVQRNVTSAREKPSPKERSEARSQKPSPSKPSFASTSPAPTSSSTSSSSTSAHPFAQSYSSKKVFYDSVRKTLMDTQGVTMWHHSESSDHAAVLCGRRKATSCRWRMRIDRSMETGKESWVVAKSSSNFVHQHATKSDEEEYSGEEDGSFESADRADLTERSARSLRRSCALHELYAETSPVPSPVPSTSTLDASSSAPSTSASRGVAPFIPNAPKPTDRYTTLAAAIAFYEQTVVPMLGVSVSRCISEARIKEGYAVLSCNRRAGRRRALCGYRIVLGRDEYRGDWVVGRTSNLEHNHGPVQKILDDPSWRPYKKGVNEQSRKRARREEVRHSSEDDNSSSDEEEEIEAHAISSSTKAPSSALAARPSARPPRLFSTPPAPSFPRSNHYFSNVPPPPPATSIFLASLTLFLAALHSSLSTLAFTLYQNGINDLALLVLFVGMDEDLRDQILMEAKVGLLQRRLLRKVLREATEKGSSL